MRYGERVLKTFPAQSPNEIMMQMTLMNQDMSAAKWIRSEHQEVFDTNHPESKKTHSIFLKNKGVVFVITDLTLVTVLTFSVINKRVFDLIKKDRKLIYDNEKVLYLNSAISAIDDPRGFNGKPVRQIIPKPIFAYEEKIINAVCETQIKLFGKKHTPPLKLLGNRAYTTDVAQKMFDELNKLRKSMPTANAGDIAFMLIANLPPVPDLNITIYQNGKIKFKLKDNK
jgi:hypothetical protein